LGGGKGKGVKTQTGGSIQGGKKTPIPLREKTCRERKEGGVRPREEQEGGKLLKEPELVVAILVGDAPSQGGLQPRGWGEGRRDSTLVTLYEG